MIRIGFALLISCTTFLLSCNSSPQGNGGITDTAVKGSYAYDAAFLKKYCRQCVELRDGEGKSKVLVSGDYQGRVMTSTAAGDTGISLGWINYNLIASGNKSPQFNPVGGEERFWLGPEGGQFGLYFKQGDSFTISHWQVPALIDTDSFELRSSSSREAYFTKTATLVNYSGTPFHLRVDRIIRLLDDTEGVLPLSLSGIPGLSKVIYQSVNRVTNTGEADWNPAQGLLSIWLLCMMPPSDQTVVLIPFKAGPESRKHITDDYFGPVPKDRLQIGDSLLYFQCDGRYRSKIGLSPAIAKTLAASYDAAHQTLSLIVFSVEPGARYVNSKWEVQREPYRGDVVNAYNDGPLAGGGQLGPFYELESSSAALDLRKGESREYRQTMIHLQGNRESLDLVARKLLGTGILDLPASK